MNNQISLFPGCVDKHRSHPLWHYVCPLLVEDCEWFLRIKRECVYGHLLVRYWPQCISMFFGWINVQLAEGNEIVQSIHGIESARRAFESFTSNDSPSGAALRMTLEYWASRSSHHPVSISELMDAARVRGKNQSY